MPHLRLAILGSAADNLPVDLIHRTVADLMLGNPQLAKDSPCIVGVVGISAVCRAMDIAHKTRVGRLVGADQPHLRLPGTGHAWVTVGDVVVDVLRDAANQAYLSFARPSERGVRYLAQPYRQELITRHLPAIQALAAQIGRSLAPPPEELQHCA